MSWQVLTMDHPLSLPLEMVKHYLRVDHQEDDQLLRHYINAGRKMIEDYTRQLMGTGTVQIYLDQWRDLKSKRSGLSTTHSPLFWIYLPVGPVTQLLSVEIRVDDKWVSCPLEGFVIDPVRQPNRLGVKRHWPAVKERLNGIRIQAKAGQKDMTALMKQCWLQIVHTLYNDGVTSAPQILKDLSLLSGGRPVRLWP